VSVSRYGITVAGAAGWDVRVYRRPAAAGELTHPIVHAATIRIPPDRGDYGSNVVAHLGAADAFLALLEFDAGDAGTALFRHRGLPRLTARDFDPRQLHRVLPGQSGVQRFFHADRRAFALYVVLGAHARRLYVVPRVQQLLESIRIGPLS
jgi:hypothetical protein